MDKIGYKFIIALVVVAGLVIGQREFFPKKEVIEVVKRDSTLVADSIRMSKEIDSLKKALAVKPQRVIIRVPVLKFKTDTIIKDSIITRVVTETIQGDTVKIITTIGLTYIESLQAKVESGNVISAESIVLGKKENKTVVKLRPKYIKDGEQLYFTEAEFMENPLGYITSDMEIPKRIVFETSSVHVLGMSNDESFIERFDKIVKSRNKF